MAKKKKETCPYCGKQFAYLSRHKCKIKDHLEGNIEDKTVIERRIERIEERKKKIKRSLKKDEKMVLNIINKQKEIYFDDLLKLTNKNRNDLERILDILYLQSKIKMQRELLDSSWTKFICSIDDYSNEVKVKEIKINKKKKDWVWELFRNQPCFVCPFAEEKCNETNLDNYNPQHCRWLTEWIEVSLKGEKYKINFDEIQEEID
ncbi:MAG: hypothetical protein ACFFAN_13480 [Promethearchaeota archaeon]